MTGGAQPNSADPATVTTGLLASDQPQPVVRVRSAQADQQLPGIQDVRLKDAIGFLEAGRIEVLSVDVFDTFLWRTVAKPTDAFVILGERLADLEWLARGVAPQTFAELRRRAERRARHDRFRDYGDAEVTLAEIYAAIPLTVVTLDDIDRLMALEVDVERELTLPDLDVLELAQLAQARFDTRLVLASNTYFSERQIQQLISRPPFAAVGVERVFTSCDHRRPKQEGLFVIMAETLGVPGSRILHVGDDPGADVASSRSSGLRALHFVSVPQPLHAVLAAEGADPAPGGPRIGRRAIVDRRYGDVGLTSLRCKTVARTDPAALVERLRPWWRFGASVLGPVLTGFTSWVHDQAAAEGVDRVHCVMREGLFLSGLINDARIPLDSSVTAGTIWLSRHVVTRAAIVAVDDVELRSLMDRRIPPTLRAFATTVGLDIGQLAELRTLADTRLDNEELVETVVDHLRARPHLVGAIRASSSAARRRLVSGLRRAVGTDTDRLVLVDLGWGLTVQRHLEVVLREEGVDLEVLGLYLLTNAAACERVLDGIRMLSYLGTCGDPDDVIPWITRSPEIIEQSCGADCGSLLDFTPDGEVVLDDSRPPARQAAERDAVQGGVRAYQREHLRYVRTVPDAAYRLGGGGERPLLLEILRRSIVQPTAEEAGLFATWAHDDNFGSSTSQVLCPDPVGAILPYLGPGDLLRTGWESVYWPFGAAALHEPWLAAATTAVVNGDLPEELFSRPRPGDTVDVFIDAGAGFSEDRRARVPSMVNAAGLSCARVTLDAPHIMAVRVDPSRFPCVARLDWIALTVSMVGCAATERIVFATDDEFAGLRFVNCWRLYDGVLLAMSDDPQIVCDLAGRVPGQVYRVDVEVAMALMPLPPRLPRHAGPETAPLDMGTRWLARTLGKELTRRGLEAGRRARPWRRG